MAYRPALPAEEIAVTLYLLPRFGEVSFDPAGSIEPQHRGEPAPFGFSERIDLESVRDVAMGLADKPLEEDPFCRLSDVDQTLPKTSLPSRIPTSHREVRDGPTPLGHDPLTV